MSKTRKKLDVRCQCDPGCMRESLPGSPFCKRHSVSCSRKAPLSGSEPDYHPSKYNKYIVKINNTYFIDGKGTINWQYAFVTDKPSVFYPLGIEAKSTIISGTVNYIGAQGTVSLIPLITGRRNVTIKFNN